LLPLVYAELRRVARRQMRYERAGHTLQASVLVNEAYLRLIQIKQIQWQDRLHFIAMASRIMRRVLVEAARAKGFHKRGAGAQKVSLDEALMVQEGPSPDFVALDVALNTLEEIEPRNCKVVEMRFFGGLSVEETADALHVSTGTIMRDWRMANSWPARELSSGRRDDA
jgi:RNA polymerase sigma factor (TIGR02999 family)